MLALLFIKSQIINSYASSSVLALLYLLINNHSSICSACIFSVLQSSLLDIILFPFSFPFYSTASFKVIYCKYAKVGSIKPIYN